MIVVIVVAVAVIDAIAVIVVFCTYICMYVVLLMVALMFSHPCWPQPYETRIAIIHVVRRHRRRMIRRPRRGRTIIQVTIGVTSCLAASASCSHFASTAPRLAPDGQLPLPAGIPLSPAFRFPRPRAGAGWAASASCWHER